ncbi:MAG: outer membrane beta-barrel protein, partial [Bacteroidota bacterium]
MKKLVPVVGALLLVLGFTNLSFAQVPSLVKVNLGVGGGLTLPVGDFGDSHKVGYNVGAKLRISGALPFRLVGTAYYSRFDGEEVTIPGIGQLGVTFEDAKIFQVGVGFEYQLIPAPIVKPYIGVDVLYNNIDLGVGNNSRFGFGGGGGVEINFGGVLHLDGMLKYQILNAGGKEGGEETLNHVSATIS